MKRLAGNLREHRTRVERVGLRVSACVRFTDGATDEEEPPPASSTSISSASPSSALRKGNVPRGPFASSKPPSMINRSAATDEEGGRFSAPLSSLRSETSLLGSVVLAFAMRGAADVSPPSAPASAMLSTWPLSSRDRASESGPRPQREGIRVRAHSAVAA